MRRWIREEGRRNHYQRHARSIGRVGDRDGVPNPYDERPDYPRRHASRLRQSDGICYDGCFLTSTFAMTTSDDSGAARRHARAAKAAQRRAGHQARLAAREHAAPHGWRGWFDGSATPNPGAIGIGALLRGPAGEQVEISRRAGHGSSSDAEYLALIALLQAAQAARATPLTVFGDSQVIIGDVGAAGAAAKGMETYRVQVRALMEQIGAVSLRWVPRHRNGDADRLSQQAILQTG